MLGKFFRTRAITNCNYTRAWKIPAPPVTSYATLKRSFILKTIPVKRPMLWTKGSTTFGEIKRRFCIKLPHDYNMATAQYAAAAGTGLTHKYGAEWLIGIPILIFSSLVVIYEKRDATVEISILSERRWERSLFFFIFFAGAAKTVCNTLEPAMFSNLVNKPLKSSVTIAARVFMKGYMTAFVCLALFSAVLSTLSFRETTRDKSKKNPDFSELIVDVTCQSYDIAASLFVTAFPLYVLGAMVGSPLFVLANRAHWSSQMARTGAQMIRPPGMMG